MKKQTMDALSILLTCCIMLTSVLPLLGQSEATQMAFTVAMPNPATQVYEVQLNCNNLDAGYTDFKIPVWMPGYYQVLQYPEKIQNFQVVAPDGTSVKWEKANRVTWRVYHDAHRSLNISYQVLADRRFVATNYLNEERGYIAPGGVFMHIDQKIELPVTVKIIPYSVWDRVATGLERVEGPDFTFQAPNFDILYDSPMLIGKLEELPSFKVRGVPHYFIGYQLGAFDQETFMSDLKKVVEAAVDIIGEIPFKEYTFIGIGPGAGGIEHHNSAAVAFSGSEKLNSFEGRKGVLSFLGHEYFHHYNAKRIRPIELGPFDYDHGSRTNMLWVAEGITAYYDEVLLSRAGLIEGDDLIQTFEQTIRSVERSPGHLFQAVTQASFDTWSDGPFGRRGDELNKTVSYYEKGPVLGLLLDFKIRHETKNRKSLDDVMRSLYYDIYKKKGRGYSEDEFRAICEKIAGVPLDEFFSYVYSVKPIDYAKYLGYAGLTIDQKAHQLPGTTIGLDAEEKDGQLIARTVEWNSPAWYEGIRRGQKILRINGKTASADLLNETLKAGQPGEIIRLETEKDGATMTISMLLEAKSEVPFIIKRKPNPSAKQQKVLEGWLRG